MQIDPPRLVSFPLKVRLFFGSFLAQWGWWFLSLSAIMMLVAVRAVDWDVLMQTPEQRVSVTGTVRKAEPYTSSKYGSGTTYTYVFETRDGGQQVQSRQAVPGPQLLGVGARTEVVYFRHNPLKSELKGHPNNQPPAWLMAIFSALLGLVVFLPLALASGAALFFSWQDAQLRLRLLRFGVLAQAEVQQLTAPGPRGPQAQVTYQYLTLAGEAIERTAIVPQGEGERLQTAGSFQVLYLPERPAEGDLLLLWGQRFWRASGVDLSQLRGSFWDYLYLLTPPAALALFLALYLFEEPAVSAFF